MQQRKTLLTLLFALLIGVTGFTSASAQELKIGYVDPQSILMKMPEMKAVQQRLRNFAERKQEELSQKQQDFQQQVQEFQQKSAVISDDAKSKEEERLGQLNAELQQYQSQIQQEMQQKQQELVGPLFDQIKKAIDQVASDQGLTYVLNTTTTNGDVIILYASESAQEKYDITDSVMRQLGI
jgi:outer membrane protein